MISRLEKEIREAVSLRDLAKRLDEMKISPKNYDMAVHTWVQNQNKKYWEKYGFLIGVEDN